MHAAIAFGLVLPLLAGVFYVVPAVVPDFTADAHVQGELARPDPDAPKWTLEPGDLCSVAKRTPDTVPATLGVRVENVTGDFDAAGAMAAVADLRAAFPALDFAPSANGIIQVRHTTHDLWFDDEEPMDVNGLACGASVLIEERRMATSTLVHEVGHVLGLDHEADSWMGTHRDPIREDDWARWNVEQAAHLAQFAVPGAPWPSHLD